MKPRSPLSKGTQPRIPAGYRTNFALKQEESAIPLEESNLRAINSIYKAHYAFTGMYYPFAFRAGSGSVDGRGIMRNTSVYIILKSEHEPAYKPAE